MRNIVPLICIVLLGLALCLSGCGTMQAQSNRVYSQRAAGETAARNSLSSAMPLQRSTDRPVHLSIPALSIDAQIEPVGVLPSGDLATPQRDPWNHVGWYSDGTVPGEPGSAVIDGHLDRPGALPAIFWNLRDVQVGSQVEVTLHSGKRLHFSVTGVEYYAPQQAPLEAIFGDGGGRYLNLITCAGDWIPEQHQTTERLVVFTTLR